MEQAGKAAARHPAPLCQGGLSLRALLEAFAHTALPMLQAEGWVRGKLRDLKDGCDLQDWEQAAQTLQREMKDFENTLIKLNQVSSPPAQGFHDRAQPREPLVLSMALQMGEQLMCGPSPCAEAVRRQLLALREQWQLLRQTATSQSRALGGLRSLQDFGRKAERLEAWMRSKVRAVGSMLWGGTPAVSLPAHRLPCPRRRSHPWKHSCRRARTRSSSPATSST